MKNSIIPALALILYAVVPAQGADFYFCDCAEGAAQACIPGTDANAGTSSLEPQQSFTSARNLFSNLNPGDRILFCRGGAFQATDGRWVNMNCTAEQPCVVSDYTPSWGTDMPEPILHHQGTGHTFRLEDGGNADRDGGYTFSNLDLRCASTGQCGWAFFLYNDVDDLLIENVSMDGYAIGIHAAGSNQPSPGSNGENDRITIRSCRIINCSSQGFLGGGDDLIIENSYFENNGGGTIFDHNIYLSHGDGVRIRGNELYRSSLNSEGQCNGASLVAHGVLNDIIIENNLIREQPGQARPTCWGIAMDTGYSSAESFTDIIIRGNRIHDVGNLGIGLNACENCLIENNVIIQTQPLGFTGIMAPDRSRNADDLMLNNVDIRNNSIFITSSGTGIRLGTEGSGHQLVSNAIHYSGSSSFSCIDTGLNPAAYEAIDYNLCFMPDASSTSEWEKGSGTTPSPLEAWRNSSGFGSHSLSMQPGFHFPMGPEYDLTITSQEAGVVDRGHPTLSASRDFLGRQRQGIPDAGAYEFIPATGPGSTFPWFLYIPVVSDPPLR